MTSVCIWHGPEGWYWDDAEDHGGFDRVSPIGPFQSFDAAKRDAEDTFPNDGFMVLRHKPEHYAPLRRTHMMKTARLFNAGARPVKKAPLFTRQHFGPIAREFAIAGDFSGNWRAIRNLCDMFERDNPRFDRAEFIRACQEVEPRT